MEIDETLVRHLIASQFPEWLGLPIKPVKLGGWDNRTFHLGEGMTVRLPSAQRYEAQVEKEQHWLPQLALLLPLPIPTPLAMGRPNEIYLWRWSVYKWIEGDIASLEGIRDLPQFAVALAEFLTDLQQVDTTGAPPPGNHNFFRGGQLSTYDAETRQALLAVKGKIDFQKATSVWEIALASEWNRPPVWIHGDIASGNLLVREGRLSAVIDFGCMGVGDPACDLVIAWNFFAGESRDAFISALSLDADTWERGRGWALWKALITLVQQVGVDDAGAERTKRIIDEILTDAV